MPTFYPKDGAVPKDYDPLTYDPRPPKAQGTEE